MMKACVVATVLTALGVGVVGPIVLPGGSSALAAEPEHKHGQGEKHKLGRKTIGSYTVSVILIGELEAGGHVDFDIKLIDATTEPHALRVWFGTADAKGSKKAEGKKGKTTYTGAIEVPKPLPNGAKLWVELETEDGVASASYDVEQHDHKH